GFYMVIQCELDSTKITELKKDWNLDKNIVRFLISKVEKGAKEPKKYADAQAEIAKAQKDAQAKEEKESPEKAPKKVATKPAPAKVEAAPVEKVAKKDDVDKKLDEILEDSSLNL
ncbi:MAG: hypothetical protein OEL89_03835, partial [Candidatus Peregrinibacteria bacterium]|nr:hypothetical protein [Candidatus Peregrinibacteria bacterium]